jgi:exopolyphosphatase/guanosine-5'-triphosphate,3'-diphosphate pyrophosphatase
VLRALISLGTNTSRFLVVRDIPNGGLEEVEQAQIGTRLGEGLAESGTFAPAAIERNLAAVRTFVARARELDASLAGIATSAMRRARDANAFAERFREIAGVPLEVIDGRLEAEASFRGATYGAALGNERIAVLDIGGGSTECAVGTAAGLEDARSLELGSVRIAERHPNLLGATPGARAHAAADAARAEIASIVAPFASLRPVAEVRCVAGTPLTIAAVAFESHVAGGGGRRFGARDRRRRRSPPSRPVARRAPRPSGHVAATRGHHRRGRPRPLGVASRARRRGGPTRTERSSLRLPRDAAPGSGDGVSRSPEGESTAELG